MLRRISWLRMERPRFPEGELVPLRGLAFVGVTSALAIGAALASPDLGSTHHWRAIVLLSALAALTPLFTVYGPQFTVYDTAAVFVVAAALFAPPAAAALIGLPACLVDAMRRRTSIVSLAHNSAAIALAALATSLLAHEASVLPHAPRALALLLALGSYAAIITGADALFGYLARGGSQPEVPWAAFAAEAALASLGVGFAALIAADPWRAPFALAPLLFIHRLQHLPALEEEAARDVKTGLLNMRCFERELERLCAGGRELARPLSLLVVDLDHLREINNRFGHLAGDAVIGEVARMIQGHLRPDDHAARFGGEEFVIAIPEIAPADALIVAARLREAVACSLFQANDPPFTGRATVSIGVAHAPGDASTPRELLHAADLALLEAKTLGRNRVVERRNIVQEPARASHAVDEPGLIPSSPGSGSALFPEAHGHGLPRSAQSACVSTRSILTSSVPTSSTSARRTRES
jgi:diguanylate cyclase (GGDEF)-like protein